MHAICSGQLVFIVLYPSIHIPHVLQKGQKSDTVNALVKFDNDNRSLGDTGKIECTADQPAVVNYSTTLNISADDPRILDDLANNPIICEFNSDKFFGVHQIHNV